MLLLMAYEDIPLWIIEGYSTMVFRNQFPALGERLKANNGHQPLSCRTGHGGLLAQKPQVKQMYPAEDVVHYSERI
ncbi:hypothetical protein PAAG_11653 [Paracoccidioides lutzii Pb01]|uniref:Uncharacterized protein n=1 Tax=Paracoccidioides lutzii (strain ATCC MYA-826 / Pb01) TaxID=502779 RepID=A0A0A2V1N1_PARBA|nr:hypothetical protein PAAG_11653 [Paracoccidioides lutzii Pb01]KGQ01661.1 hypothetical protein PAAG_11653 [Paracoccidioides lutzii Pb01]